MYGRLAALVVSLVALAVFPALAQAETVTISLTSWTTIETQQLRSPSDTKPRKGDKIEFRDLLVNRGRAQFGRQEGHAIAWDEGIIRYTTDTQERIHVLAIFPGLGSITYDGLLAPDGHGNSVIPIIAGSGVFKGATGTVTIGSGTETAPNIFTVTVPGNPIDLSSGGSAA